MSRIVDKQTIIERSKKYGNNFPFLVQIWKNFLKQRYDIDVPLTPGDVAFMFSLHKISRLANNPGDQDTLKDMINYAWLGIDYEEYVKLLMTEEKNDKDVISEQESLQRWCFNDNQACVFNDDNCHAIPCRNGYNQYSECDWNEPIVIE